MEFEKKKPTGADLMEARRYARLTPDEAAKACGIHRTTYARQENDTARVSVAAYRLLILLGGHIPGNEWQGWRLSRVALYSPEGTEYTPGDLYAVHWLHQSEKIHRGCRCRPLVRFLRAELLEKTGEEYDQAWFHGYRFTGYEHQNQKAAK